MKFSAQILNLSSRLTILAKVVSGANIEKKLDGVVLSLEGNDLSIKVTDSSVFVQDKFTVKGGEDGAVMVPCALLGQYLTYQNGSDETTISSAESGHGINLVAPLSKGAISGYDILNFPPLTEVEMDDPVTIDRSKFLTAIMLGASYAHKSRKTLDGIMVSQNDKDITFVATDGVSLAEYVLEAHDGVLAQPYFIPLHVVKSITACISTSTEEKLTIAFGKEMKNEGFRMTIKCGGMEIITRALVPHFPPYKDFIPKDAPTKAKFLPADFIAAINQVKVVTDDKMTTVSGEIEFASAGLVISTDGGRGEVDMKIDLPSEVEGEHGIVKLNLALLKPFLSRVGKEQVEVCYKDNVTPLVFSGKNARFMVSGQRK